jgi:uncharacterized membrane protein
MSDLRVFWAFVPFAILVLLSRKLPSSVWSATLGSVLAGIAAGAASLGVLFSAMGFFGMNAQIDPGQLIVIVVVCLLLMVHWAMLSAESSVANYIIGRNASYSSPYREYFALVGGLVGHAIWWFVAYKYMNPTNGHVSILRDEFSSLFIEMIIPSALLAAPGAAIGAALAPKV